jgi:hypothetical protein
MTTGWGIDGDQGGPAVAAIALVPAAESEAMRVRMNKMEYDHPRHLVTEGKPVADQQGAWSEHGPSAAEGQPRAGLAGTITTRSRNAAAQLLRMIDPVQR